MLSKEMNIKSMNKIEKANQDKQHILVSGHFNCKISNKINDNTIKKGRENSYRTS